MRLPFALLLSLMTAVFKCTATAATAARGFTLFLIPYSGHNDSNQDDCKYCNN